MKNVVSGKLIKNETQYYVDTVQQGSIVQKRAFYSEQINQLYSKQKVEIVINLGLMNVQKIRLLK